jgi:adenine deaminase
MEELAELVKPLSEASRRKVLGENVTLAYNLCTEARRQTVGLYNEEEDTVSYDIVIKNGLVVDGSGGAPYRADVAIHGDRIAAVGKITDLATRTIDAEGHIVTPGFVDIHTHLDAQISWDPMASSSC